MTRGADHTAGSCQRRAIAIDGHVHLYPEADLGQAFLSGHRNLAAAAKAAGADEVTTCLLLTETPADRAFDRLASGELKVPGWRVTGYDADPLGLLASREEGAGELILVAGRQIVTEEALEVLAIGTLGTIPDGLSVARVLQELQASGTPAILPWGLGKWMGSRGRVLDNVVATADPGSVMLGDNAGRPLGWREPPAFREAAASGLPVLPGSDPFPVPGAEFRIGEYGFLFDAQADPSCPAADICRGLKALRQQPRVIGGRQSILRVVANQAAFLRQKRRKTRG